MEQELYAAMMRNDRNEKIAVIFLSDNPTDAQDKAKTYAKQLNGVIERAYHVPDINGITIVKTTKRPKEGN